MRLTIPIDISNLKFNDPQFQYLTARILDAIKKIINGNVSITDNLDVNIQQVNFASANVQQDIFHNLGRVPKGFLLIGSQAACNVYNGTTASTSSTIYLQSTVATAVTLLIF